MEQLHDAAAEGRIDLDELDPRLEQALASTTYGLAVLTADLPRPKSSESQPPLVLKGGMYGASRGPGRWEAPRHVTLGQAWGA